MLKNDLLSTFEEFYAWLQNKKSNQLSVSNSTYPKRVHIVTLDLSQAPQSSSKNGLFTIPVNFNSVQVEKIYSTTTLADKAGSVKLIVDSDNTSNIQNSKTLFANDSFSITDGAVANGYLNWDIQSDTSVQIAFFIDIDYRSGSTKTAIVGTVNVTASPALAVTGVSQKVVGSVSGGYVVAANELVIATYADLSTTPKTGITAYYSQGHTVPATIGAFTTLVAATKFINS